MNLLSFPRMLLISVCVLAAGCASAPSVPGPLRVPGSPGLIADLRAKGVQIYQCQPAKNDPSQFEWSFKQPEAALSTKVSRSVCTHYAGPTWEADDGHP